ncbi:uncharacterized protein HMPREF1541_07372 [Cyphellophora europaea CBS 101466]|uniref:Wax synthase domain-containing protein n=1 Tax=Cyphellophora europaea (strain CBS 101466) TaxID=1220924 RepID=W2RPU0_CYPE1|nr:uncharacterized protein HMPREF1541_07372 [Cyphellophora europaea CBS 101466]ETN37749.1 hypothetical protein HMPREF1541_07372 [Cyphellophora europaea CBS 101466]
MEILSNLWDQVFNPEIRPGLHPIPGSVPLTLEAAVCPPLVYYIALLFLAPPPPNGIETTPIKLLRNSLAILAGVLFFRLPLAYHVPQSIGLTYQLGLVGLYGGCRVVDAFFISPYLFGHIPRRVRYEHVSRPSTPALEHKPQNLKEWSNGGVKDPFMGINDASNRVSHRARKEKSTPPSTSTSSDTRRPSIMDHAEDYFSRTLSGPDPKPVYETAHTEEGWPQTFLERASWAFELELSMRGIGFTWTTADVRHTRRTWLPTVSNRVHSLFLRSGPVLFVAWTIIKYTYTTYLFPYADISWDEQPYHLFDTLPLANQLLLTGALGAFLMAAFSFGHSLFAIVLHPLSPSPLAFFPPLYTTRVWDITSVRRFWSYGWHRLFARLFLVYGVWPGEWLERKLLGKRADQPADIGKVLGGFGSSAFVHAFSVRGVLEGNWFMAAGEAKFFALNGVAVVVEGIVVRVVRAVRTQRGWPSEMWYDAWFGRVWWIAVLLGTGRNFARGWVKACLVREMAFM